jgi:Ca-activated chloride channel family protein
MRRRGSERTAVLLAAVLAAIALAAPCGSAQEPDDEVRLSSDLVLVPIAARHDKGGLVRDLRAGELTVREDGRPQEISFFTLDTAPLDVVLLVDASGSIAETKSTLQSAALAFAKQLRPDDRVSVVSFADRPVVRQEWTADVKAVAEAVRAISTEGATALYGSIVATVYERFAERPTTRRRAVVVLTDGDDTISTVTSRSAARAAMRFEASVYVVSVNRVARETFEQLANAGTLQTRAGYRAAVGEMRRAGERLEALASETGGRVVELRRRGDLERAYAEVADEIRSRYLVGYYPEGERAAGFHAIDVSTRRTGVVLRARRGYYRDEG